MLRAALIVAVTAAAAEPDKPMLVLHPEVAVGHPGSLARQQFAATVARDVAHALGLERRALAEWRDSCHHIPDSTTHVCPVVLPVVKIWNFFENLVGVEGVDTSLLKSLRQYLQANTINSSEEFFLFDVRCPF